MLFPATLAVPAAQMARPVAAPMGAPLRIVGYNDMAEMLTEAVHILRTYHPALKVILDLKSTRSAPPALLDRSSDLAPMGVELSEDQRAAYRARWGQDPIGFRIAHDSLKPAALSSPTGILVATDSPLTSISMAQLREIFSGTASAHVGGGNSAARRPLTLYGLAPDTALAQNFLASLGAREFAPGHFDFRQSRDVAAAVARDPQAIGFANLNHAGNGTRALTIVDAQGKPRKPTYNGIYSGRYPLDRFLMIYTHPDASRSARLLLTFLLSRQGQWIISRGSLGYIPLNPAELAIERRKLIHLKRIDGIH